MTIRISFYKNYGHYLYNHFFFFLWQKIPIALCTIMYIRENVHFVNLIISTRSRPSLCVWVHNIYIIHRGTILLPNAYILCIIYLYSVYIMWHWHRQKSHLCCATRGRLRQENIAFCHDAFSGALFHNKIIYNNRATNGCRTYVARISRIDI